MTEVNSPSRLRWQLGSLTAILFLCAFFFPQEAPLVFYPLNEPGGNPLYLEITCGADKAGEVAVWYDGALGLDVFDSVRWPISVARQAYTYHFPLPDAPIVGLKMTSVGGGGTLTIKAMRIVDRKGTEVLRLRGEMFSAASQIASIHILDIGWTLTSVPEATNPMVRVDIGSPIVQMGMNTRNLVRCLLSCSYLTLTLSVIFLAVLAPFPWPKRTKEVFLRIGFVVALAFLFSVVENRRLIRESIHSARFDSATVRSELKP